MRMLQILVLVSALSLFAVGPAGGFVAQAGASTAGAVDTTDELVEDDDGIESTDDGNSSPTDGATNVDSNDDSDVDLSTGEDDQIDETTEELERTLSNGSLDESEPLLEAVEEPNDVETNRTGISLADRLRLDASVGGNVSVANGELTVTAGSSPAEPNTDESAGDEGGVDEESDGAANASDEETGGEPIPSSSAGSGVAIGAGATGAALLARRMGTTAILSSAPGGGGASSLLSSAATLLREWGTRLVALLGYQRFSDDDPLEHDARSAIYKEIRSSPGTYLAEISDETGVPVQTARYHLRILEFENLVSRKDVRGHRRYFPIDTESAELDAALNDEATAAVLYALADDGPDSVSGLADTLDRDPSTVTHHLGRLEEDGLVERERDGRAVVNRLSADAERLLAGRQTERERSDSKPEIVSSETRVGEAGD
ncbi:winged helix-turn-helix transcriptional regulator [Natrarchaeobius chitinivorans]|uniref:ArsR family transcriptional regulator n=1 Tax=Natrarchaeobius chitinivorans TaxID=1679083 RepID=A0A3N6MNQ5_NATCH|nr:helix-turn-helix domain-containing protein [Natrarchaeobius chitinivorans]RQG97761.1 ArsR family transcriptional regulator [Natrarchaeobius chitinivorans]